MLRIHQNLLAQHTILYHNRDLLRVVRVKLLHLIWVNAYALMTSFWLVKKLIIARYISHHRRRLRILVSIWLLVAIHWLHHVSHRQRLLHGHGVRNTWGLYLVSILLGGLLILNPLNVLVCGLIRKTNLLRIKLFGFLALLLYLEQLVVVPHDRVLVTPELLDFLRVQANFIVHVGKFGLRLREKFLDFTLSFFDFRMHRDLKSVYLGLGLFWSHAYWKIVARGSRWLVIKCNLWRVFIRFLSSVLYFIS